MKKQLTVKEMSILTSALNAIGKNVDDFEKSKPVKSAEINGHNMADYFNSRLIALQSKGNVVELISRKKAEELNVKGKEVVCLIVKDDKIVKWYKAILKSEKTQKKINVETVSVTPKNDDNNRPDEHKSVIQFAECVDDADRIATLENKLASMEFALNQILSAVQKKK